MSTTELFALWSFFLSKEGSQSDVGFLFPATISGVIVSRHMSTTIWEILREAKTHLHDPFTRGTFKHVSAMQGLT